MADWKAILIFITAFTAFSIIWGRILWYFDEKSKLLTQLVFTLMSFIRMSFPEIKSIILCIIYYSFGILGALLFAGIYHLNIADMFGFTIQFIPLILLGIIAEISLASSLISIYIRSLHNNGMNPYAEIQKIPWISGIRKLPKILIPFAPAVSGFLEEFFFRGILLLILMKKLLVPPWIAIALATIFFLLEQLLQLRTSIQVAMISCGCVAISLVGGLLVFYTSSIIPAGLSHASFVIFFLEYGRAIQEKSPL